MICGPTATGKSGLAIALAEYLNTVILSADSRQVYKEFDIGTAKPTVQERQQVAHYLIDICEPTDNCTLAQYQEQANQLIQHFHQQGKTPLLVGGTGLYIQAVTEGLIIPRVAPQVELRSQLAQLAQTQLYAYLQQVDPVSAQRIHANDQVRTLRALEVYYVTGIPLSQQQGRNPPSYPICKIGLESEQLTHRIQQRTLQMLEKGWLAEVEFLLKQYGDDLPLLKTLGYAEMKQHIAGETSLEEAIQLTVLHTRQFAKRQRTWFRADAEITWLNGDDAQLLEKLQPG